MLETTATRSSSASSEASMSGTPRPLGRAGACSAARGRGCRRRRCPGSRRRWPGSRSRPGRRVASEPRELLEPHEARDAEDEDQRDPDGEGGHRGRGGVEGVLEIGEELDGSGVSFELVRKSDSVKLSKEMAKAKIAPATTPGLMTPRVISKNARTGWAPRLCAASSSARSKCVSVAVTVRIT
jgi:hypothetical protein